jgi:hypothetical protein
MTTKIGKMVARFAVPVLLGAALAGCATTNAFGPITQITVTATGLGPEINGCAGYTVTEDQVRKFFAKAVLISGRQEHDHWDLGPCSAEGTFKNRYDTWRWVMHSLGTAYVKATNEEYFIFGDPDASYMEQP